MKTPLLLASLRHCLLPLLLAVVLPARAQTPQYMTYQGYLTDGNGNVLGGTNGAKLYDVVFRLWDIPTGGAIGGADELYAEIQTVTVNNGYFSVLLGQGSQYTVEPHAAALAGLFATNNPASRYIELTVQGIGVSGANVTLSPRLQLVSAPYAFQAANAGNAENLVNAAGLNLISASGNTVTLNGTLNATAVNGNGAGLTGVALLSGGNSLSGGQTITGGNVGIGTTSPGDLLSLQGGALSFANPADPVPYVGIDYDNGSDALRVRANQGSAALNTTLMTINRNSGYVGMGTTTPAAGLQVNGGILVRGGVPGPGGVNNNGYAFLGNGGDDDSGMFSTADGTLQFFVNNSEQIRIGPGGYVGIGTTTPAQKLDVNGNCHFGGNVGIGTIAPGYPLEVDGYDYYSIGIAAYYYLYATTPETEYIPGPLTEAVTIRASNWIEANGLISPSDRRIKDIVRRSDAPSDLETIKKLQVTDYRLKDRVLNGDRIHKGFIAQEVQKVIPEAVNKSKGFVPDIYAVAEGLQFDPATQSLRVSMNAAHGLKPGDLIRLILDEATTEHLVAAVPDEKAFVVSGVAAAPKRAFVYGKQVDDFLAVDYDRIFSTGISAVQELAKHVEALELREANLAELEEKSARVDALEQQVADLKQMVAQLAKSAKFASDSAPTHSASTAAALAKPFNTASREP